MKGTPDDKQTYRWDAFISYSRKDEMCARKLEADLEHYLPPKGALAGRRKLNIFRDIQNLVGNELGAAFRGVLRQSQSGTAVARLAPVRPLASGRGGLQRLGWRPGPVSALTEP